MKWEWANDIQKNLTDANITYILSIFFHSWFINPIHCYTCRPTLDAHVQNFLCTVDRCMSPHRHFRMPNMIVIFIWNKKFITMYTNKILPAKFFSVEISVTVDVFFWRWQVLNTNSTLQLPLVELPVVKTDRNYISHPILTNNLHYKIDETWFSCTEEIDEINVYVISIYVVFFWLLGLNYFT